ncbi:MAG: hypothetical protein JSR85_00625 [Proteobacteria bacterium]|nr:hypothetical protein [Pseudomonadota bacterium]
MADFMTATPPMITAASQAANKGTNISNLYINIAGQGTGTLTGANVDPKLAKADRLLAISEQMRREVNTAADNTLFSAGEIDASWVYIEILRTQASIFVQNSFLQGNNIGPINVYRADVINGVLKVTEEIDYTNNIITKIDTTAVALEGQRLDVLKVWFRFTGRTDTLFFFDQNGQPIGQNVSTVDFTLGTLQASAGGGGGNNQGGGSNQGGGGGNNQGGGGGNNQGGGSNQGGGGGGW